MAKIDLIKEKFKDKKTVIDLIEIAALIDKTKTKKHVEHIVKYTLGVFNDLSDVILTEINQTNTILNNFEQLSTNGLIENPDLNSYKTIRQISNVIKEAEMVKSIGKAKKEIKVLYEDESYKLILPLSFDAASVYGSGTKWCVTQDSYFYRYSDNGILIFFIDKEKNRKIGIYFDMSKSFINNGNGVSDTISSEILSMDLEKPFDEEMFEIVNFSNKFSCWTDWDNRVDLMFAPIPLNLKEVIIDYCKNNIQNASLFNDIELINLGDFCSYGIKTNEVGDAVENEVLGIAMTDVFETELN
jgi:hypothetical protein